MSNKSPAPVIPADLAEMYSVLEGQLAALPEADDSDAMVRIFAMLGSAARPEDLNNPWDAAGLEGLAGHHLRIRELTRRPSDFKESRVGYYIVANGADLSTGSDFVFTTGSEATMKQLVVAHINGWLPLDVEPIVDQTKAGNTVIHLKVLGRPHVGADGSDF